jgi:ubiquinone/menaquinone biosynthesis C-methylase UbiE
MSGQLSDFSKVIREVHDKIADKYGIVDIYGNPPTPFDGWIFEESVLKPINYIVSKYINANDILLELGCGNGQIVQAYIKNGAPKIIGLDFSFSMLKTACQRADLNQYKKKFIPVQGDLYALPFKSEQIDFALIYGVLEHLEEPILALKEIFRVLKPSGIFTLGVPRKYSLAFFSYLLFGLSVPKWTTNQKWDFSFGKKLRYYKFYSLREVKRFFQTAWDARYQIIANIPVCYSFLVGLPQKLQRKLFAYNPEIMFCIEKLLSKIYKIPAGNYLIIKKS